MSSKSVGGVETEQSDATITSYLVENPRMIGVLFTILMLLSQVGVTAGLGPTINGP